ncbi:putative holin-like toxin [Paenibacillus sp. FSL R10-2199]
MSKTKKRKELSLTCASGTFVFSVYLTLMIMFGMFIIALLNYLKKK